MNTSHIYLVALEAFTSVFIALNPIGTIPVFAALTGGTSKAYKKKMVLRASLIVVGILTVFALSGYKALNLLGVDFYSFKVAGGILLLILGIQFVFKKEEEDHDNVEAAMHSDEEKVIVKNPKDISVFPLGIPLLAGPAVITTTIIQMQRVSGDIGASAVVLVTIWLVILISYFLLIAAGGVSKLLGQGGVNIATRIVGILLCSMACEFWIEGLRESKLFMNLVS